MHVPSNAFLFSANLSSCGMPLGGDHGQLLPPTFRDLGAKGASAIPNIELTCLTGNWKESQVGADLHCLGCSGQKWRSRLGRSTCMCACQDRGSSFDCKHSADQGRQNICSSHERRPPQNNGLSEIFSQEKVRLLCGMFRTLVKWSRNIRLSQGSIAFKVNNLWQYSKR